MNPGGYGRRKTEKTLSDLTLLLDLVVTGHTPIYRCKETGKAVSTKN